MSAATLGRTLRGAVGAALLAAGMAGPAAAQAPAAGSDWPAAEPAHGDALLRRVAAAPDGTVRLTFALRPGVCGTGGNIRVRGDDRTYIGTTTIVVNRARDVEWEDDCPTGPGRLALDVAQGQVTDVRVHVGGRWRDDVDRRITDLGAVSTREVAGMLLALAARGEGKAARAAIFPATLADSVALWPSLLRIARDASRPRDARTQATHYLARAAGDAATRGLRALADDPDREVRIQAVHALSRRPANDAIPELTRIARTHRDPETRRQALFWLGRIDDPRVLGVFEEMLAKR